MTGRLGPRKGGGCGEDIGVPEKNPRVEATGPCEEQGQRGALPSRPCPGGGRGWGFCGWLWAGAGGGGWAGGGGDVGALAAGVAGDTQERRPPRREQRRAPTAPRCMELGR